MEYIAKKKDDYFMNLFFIFSQINKTMPLSKGQDDSIYICNKFLKN